MHSKIIELRTEFHGRGEMRGYIFKQLERNAVGYLFKVTHPDVNRPHYEVFRRKINKRFNVVSYPKGESFGIWGWTFPSLEQAQKKLHEVTIKHARIYPA